MMDLRIELNSGALGPVDFAFIKHNWHLNTHIRCFDVQRHGPRDG